MNTRLLDAVKYAYENSPFYREHFSAVNMDDFSISDFENLPFTSKADVSLNNDSFYCVSRDEISEFVSTSGTSGTPITLALTKSDLQRLAHNEFTSLSKMGFDRTDTFQLLLTLDRQFMAGIAYYSGIIKLGARVLRNGPGGVLNQLKSIDVIKPTVLIAVPSFILKLIEYSEQHKIDLDSSSVKSIVCIGEPIHNRDFSHNNLAKSILDKWDVSLHSTYASTEMATAFYQCQSQRGCHNNDELLYTEILDENGVHVNNGESGEIVITTLGVEGMPFVRYRTGDITTYWSGDCGCGEGSIRIGPIEGRNGEMIKFRGTTIYPQNIYNALGSMPKVKNYFVKVTQEQITTTDITILLSSDDFVDFDIKEITSTLNSLLRVTPSVTLIPGTEIDKLISENSGRKKSRIRFIQNPES